MGHFLSFEGIDGVGKSTQAARLHKSLISRYGANAATLWREPGSTPAGEKIRDLLLHQTDVPLTPMSQLLLFNAARVELINDVIARDMLLGKWVIMDRYVDSTVAYQHYGSGLDLDHVRIIQDIVVGDVMPALTFILDAPLDLCWERTQLDRFKTNPGYMRRVQAGYRQIASQVPSRCVLLDTRDSDEEAIHNAIWSIIEFRLL